MKKLAICLPLVIAVVFSAAAMASAVSFYPLPAPVEKEVPKAERPPSNAVGIYSASWQASAAGVSPVSVSGSLVTIESSLGSSYVLGGAINSLKGGNTVYEVHATRRLPKELGVQVGALFWEGGYTDLELLATKSFRGKGAKQTWAADFGAGVYHWDDEPGYVQTGSTAFVAASYDLSKNITANLSVWSIVLKHFTVTRTAAGVGYRF